MLSTSGYRSSKQGSSPDHTQDGGAIMRDSESVQTQESPVFEVHLNEAAEDDDDNDSSEDDVHQCGRCKQVFHSLASYLEHKSKKVCKVPSKPKPKAQPTPTSQNVSLSQHHQQEPQSIIMDSISQVTENAQHDVTSMGIDAKENIFEAAIKNTIFKQLQTLVYEQGQPEEQPHERSSNEAIRKLDTIEQNALSMVSLPEKQNCAPKVVSENEKKGKPSLVMTISTKKVKEAAEAANMEVKKGRGRRKKIQSLKPDEGFSELTPLKPIQRKRGRPAKLPFQVEKEPINEQLPPENTPKENFVIQNNQVSASMANIPCVPVLPTIPHMPPKPVSQVASSNMDSVVSQPPLTSVESVVGVTMTPTDSVPLAASDNVGFGPIASAFGPIKDEVKPKGKRGRPAKKILVHRCPICKLEFPNKDSMAEHKSKHSKMFKCRICHESFFTEDKLDKHMDKETHHYPCDSCSKICLSKASLQRHKTTHNEKSHVCDICNRAFKAARDMKSHKISRHSDERNFICEICHKGFSRREKLKRHSLIHSPNRPAFQCPFKNHVGCDKVFYRKDKLTRHLYSHSKVKPFKCDHCDKSFARTDNLREHLRTHTGVFRYYCTVCGKGQPGPKKFIQHMIKQHNIDTPEVPPPLEENAPEPLVQQHKAVVKAETAARAAKAAATAFKKERIKLPGPGQENQPSAGDQIHVQEDDAANQVALSLQQHQQQQGQISITQHVSTIASVPLQQFHGVATITSIPALHNVVQPRPTLQTDDSTGMRDIRTPTGHNTTSTPRTPGSQHHQHPHSQNEGVAVIHNELTRQGNPEDVGTIQIEPTDDSVNVEGHQNRVAVQLLPHAGLQPTLSASMTQQYTTLLNCDLAAIGEAVVRNQNILGAVYRSFPPH